MIFDVKEFAAISGVSGVYKMVGVRKDGLIAENLDTQERQFFANRTHQFSPFEQLSIYIDGGSTPLGEVFGKMSLLAAEGTAPVSEKASSADLRNYFTKVLPDHDRDRVHSSDIKKVLKWYAFLSDRNLLKEATAEAVVEESSSEEK